MSTALELSREEWKTYIEAAVDLVVEGLEGKDYWEAWRVTEEIVGDRLVDFIEMETVGEFLRQAIHRSGVEL
jgi:hypothetical protein